MAKRFFYVCAGVMCLVVAFHFAAGTVHAQGTALSGAEFQLWFPSPYGFIASGVVGRQFFYSDPDGSQHSFAAPIPGTAGVAATLPSRGMVLLDDGSVLQFTGTEWAPITNILSGATAARRGSWGELKARYRGASSQVDH